MLTGLAAGGAGGRVGPRGVLLLTGPKGSGKSFAAGVMSRAAFGIPAGRFNLAELVDRHDLSRLVGAPPGFIGHDRAGTLFQFTERHPQGLILLEGWNKAHPAVRDYLLEVIRRGEAADSRGRRTDFRPYVFVVEADTSLQQPAVGHQIGFLGKPTVTLEDSQALAAEVDAELATLADGVVVFTSLGDSDYDELLSRRVEGLAKEIMDRTGVRTTMSPDATRMVRSACIADGKSARRLVGAFDRLVAAPAHAHSRQAAAGDSLCVDAGDKGLVFSLEQPRIETTMNVSSGEARTGCLPTLENPPGDTHG